MMFKQLIKMTMLLGMIFSCNFLICTETVNGSNNAPTQNKLKQQISNSMKQKIQQAQASNNKNSPQQSSSKMGTLATAGAAIGVGGALSQLTKSKEDTSIKPNNNRDKEVIKATSSLQNNSTYNQQNPSNNYTNNQDQYKSQENFNKSTNNEQFNLLSSQKQPRYTTVNQKPSSLITPNTIKQPQPIKQSLQSPITSSDNSKKQSLLIPQTGTSPQFFTNLDPKQKIVFLPTEKSEAAPITSVTKDTPSKSNFNGNSQPNPSSQKQNISLGLHNTFNTSGDFSVNDTFIKQNKEIL